MKNDLLRVVMVLCLLSLGVGHVVGENTYNKDVVIDNVKYKITYSVSASLPSAVAKNATAVVAGVEDPTSSYEIKESITFSDQPNGIITITGASATVIGIGDGAFLQSPLTSFTIPEFITSIGNRAFEGSKLKSIEIPSTVKKIGDQAFLGSRALQSLIINEGVESIGSHAFASYLPLTTVTIPSSVTTMGDSAFFSSLVESATVAGVLGNGAFLGATHLQKVTFNGPVQIGDKAFLGCRMLSSVEGWENVRSIGVQSFYKVSLGGKITIPAEVSSIGAEAFYNTKITEVVFEEPSSPNPKSQLKSIGERAFNGCSSLTKVTFPDLSGTEFSIGDGAFQSTGIQELICGYKMKDVCVGAFADCTALTSVYIKKADTNFGKNAFMGCDNLQYVLYDDLKYVGTQNFANEYSNPLYLAKHLMYGRPWNKKEITDLEVSGRNSIKPYAFAGANLNSITFPAAIKHIASGAFSGSSIGKFVFADVSTLCSMGYDFVGDNPLALGHHLYFKGLEEEVTDLVIPYDVTSISDYALVGCEGLKSITLPFSLTSIGRSAFIGCCNLEKFNVCWTEIIPEGVAANSFDPSSRAMINPNAKLCCPLRRSSLYADIAANSHVQVEEVLHNNQIYYEESVTLDQSVFGLESKRASKTIKSNIKDQQNPIVYMFEAYDDDVMGLHFSGYGILTYRDCITAIDDNLFKGCKYVTKIQLPETVESIGKDAFNSVPTSSDINIPASLTSIAEGGFGDHEIAIQKVDLTDEAAIGEGNVVTVETVTYSRPDVTSDWGTLFLPYAIESTPEVKLYQLKSADFANHVMSFVSLDHVEANQPCIFHRVGTGDIQFSAQGVTLKPTAGSTTLDESGVRWILKGTYTQKTLRTDENGNPDPSANDVYFISGDKFCCATKNAVVTIKPYRAWFEVEGQSAAANVRNFSIEVVDSSTGVKHVLTEDEKSSLIFDMCGTQISEVQSGKINIVNGKKTIVK